MAPSRERPELAPIPSRAHHEPETPEELAEVTALTAYLTNVQGVGLSRITFRAHPYALFHLIFDLAQPAAIAPKAFRWLWCQVNLAPPDRLLLEPKAWHAPDRTLILIPRWDGPVRSLREVLDHPDTRFARVKLAVLYRGTTIRFDLPTLH